MRKRWLFATVATGVLALGVLGGTVLAQETMDESGKPGIFGRVAEIMGVGEDEVKDAFEQAQAEIREEKSDARFDKLVESGRLTEEQATELLEWMDGRPEVDGAFGPAWRFRGHGFGQRGGREFTFRFGGEIPEMDGLFPELPEIQEHLEMLRDGGAMREFDGRGFRFFFGPHGGNHGGGGTETEEAPAVGGVSL